MFPAPSSRYILGSLPWYSVLIVAGAAIAIMLALREEKRVGLKKDTIIDLALWLLPLGIIGARIYYVAFSWPDFRDDPLSILKIWEGGIAIYGAVIAGLVVVLVFSRVRTIPALLLCDLIAPGLVLAQGIGRWGNYFNMEAYGAPVENPALCFFPFSVLIPSDSSNPWHMATFFYESVWDIGIFILLIILRRRLFRRQGDVFFFYAFLYACGRLVIEDFRMDSLYAGSSVRISQLLSVLVCVSLLILYFNRSLKRSGGILRILLFAFSLAFAFPVLAYSLNIIIHPAEITLLHRFILLFSYSAVSILSLFILYGRSSREEVLYAIHKA